MSWPRRLIPGLLWLALVTACAPAAPPQALLTPTATVLPSPTPLPVFAAGSTIAGVEVGGLDAAAAATRLAAELPELAPLVLRAGAQRLSLQPDELELQVPLDELLTEAAPSLGAAEPISLPLRLSLDETALREHLADFAAELGSVTPTLSLITSTEPLSRSFSYTPTASLDLDAAVAQVNTAIAEGKTGPLTLKLDEGAPPRVPFERLREEVAALAEELPGVVGFDLIDLESGEELSYNARTVFAGASTIKAAILLYSYINLDRFDELEQGWLEKMIVESDNLAANGMLAAAAGGQGTEYAFIGADAMSTMLQEELGLRHTYLYIPFEAVDYIKLYKPKYRCGPTGPVGEKPYTEMGACLRAEPASMARIYQLIDQCASGTGELLERFERLKPRRCQEMLDRLATNDDTTRMVAGVAEGIRVEHKSGWIEDMNGDVGIVRSPGGDYVLAVYYYRPLTGNRAFWTDEEMAPVIAAFSHLAYTAYNPVVAE